MFIYNNNIIILKSVEIVSTAYSLALSCWLLNLTSSQFHLHSPPVLYFSFSKVFRKARLSSYFGLMILRSTDFLV